MVIFIYTGPP